MSDNQATDPVARVRDLATTLPGVDERMPGEETIFAVEGQAFARVNEAGTLRVRTADDDRDWASIDLTGDADWTLIEDRIARSWELAAPAGLLEAGGR